jgi:hypothetical protein
MLKPDPDANSAEALVILSRHASDPRHRDVIISAAAAKATRLRSVEEAELLTKLMTRIDPPDFELLANANRVAKRRTDEQAVAEFWSRYALAFKELNPYGFQDREGLDGVFYRLGSEQYLVIRADILRNFPQLPSSSKEVAAKLPSILRARASDKTFPAYLLLVERTSELVARFLEAVPSPSPGIGEQVAFDVTDCYIQRPLRLNPGVSAIDRRRQPSVVGGGHITK